ncbi:ATP-binding protein [Nostoc sp. WHI]|uniref:ATP-binding protein n=1 Tax=Nostoc sp. WHI TaxID=2650611 RepID=UPI0018C4704F|nr:ATP-binding protein [Nostoc sp. WHI]MBG1266646.1 ATP-binding protein [Nostoc sp. WHI]
MENNEGELVRIPNRELAVIAKYIDQKLPEYNANPLIQALPPIFSAEEFAAKVTKIPFWDDQDRNLESHYRFHCVERLSRYFDPQAKTIELQKLISVVIMTGYLSRNPLKPEYASRSRQIYNAIEDGGGKNLENYVNLPTSASGLTLIGSSGIGKTTNFINILKLYPQVICHPEYSVYQIVWLQVECPKTLKGLCTDIFAGIDKLLGTNLCRKFNPRYYSEDYLLAQLAQVAHTHHLGVLVIDEIQNLVNSTRSRAEILDFLVKLDNTIGIPVIRVGTNEAISILQGNFRNARRSTGEGSVIWERMINDEEWYFFMEGMWEYQWTKTPVPFSHEINEIFYNESQGIIDIAVKLYKMVQWKAISLRSEEIITVDLIRQAAKDGLYLVEPMLDAIRSGDKERMMKYKDITPVDITQYKQKCLYELESVDLKEIRRLAKKQQTQQKVSPKLNYVIIELLNLKIDAHKAKQCAEQVIFSSDEDSDIPSLVDKAYFLALGGGQINEKVVNTSTENTKLKPKYHENDIRLIVENAKKDKKSAYEYLKMAGIIKDPIKDFINI